MGWDIRRGTSHQAESADERGSRVDSFWLINRLPVCAASMDEDWASSGIMDELSHAMQRRRRLRFVFLGIHLPDESAAELTRLCQPYSNASFIQLKRPAAQIDGLFSSRLSAKHALEIDIRRPYQAAVIGRPVEFCVVMRNFSDQPIPAGSRLYMNPNGYFRSSFVELPEIRCGLVQGVVLRAVPKGRVTVFDLQERCELSIQTSDRQLIATQPFFLVRPIERHVSLVFPPSPGADEPAGWWVLTSGHGGLHRRPGRQTAPRQGPQHQPIRHRSTGRGQGQLHQHDAHAAVRRRQRHHGRR